MPHVLMRFGLPPLLFFFFFGDPLKSKPMLRFGNAAGFLLLQSDLPPELPLDAAVFPVGMIDVAEPANCEVCAKQIKFRPFTFLQRCQAMWWCLAPQSAPRHRCQEHKRQWHSSHLPVTEQTSVFTSTVPPLKSKNTIQFDNGNPSACCVSANRCDRRSCNMRKKFESSTVCESHC